VGPCPCTQLHITTQRPPWPHPRQTSLDTAHPLNRLPLIVPTPRTLCSDCTKRPHRSRPTPCRTAATHHRSPPRLLRIGGVPLSRLRPSRTSSGGPAATSASRAPGLRAPSQQLPPMHSADGCRSPPSASEPPLASRRPSSKLRAPEQRAYPVPTLAPWTRAPSRTTTHLLHLQPAATQRPPLLVG
jgi:hypothetical protein